MILSILLAAREDLDINHPFVRVCKVLRYAKLIPLDNEKHLVFDWPEMRCFSGLTQLRGHRQCWLSCGKMILLVPPSLSLLAYIR